MTTMTATTMPEAIRQNRTELETGHPRAGSALFAQRKRKKRRRSSVDSPRGAWDGLDRARLDEGRVSPGLMTRAGQETGLTRR